MSSSRTESLTIAKRYATAMFSLSLAEKNHATLVAEFRALAAALAASPELMVTLKNPLLSRAKKAAVLNSIMAKASALTQQSLGVLAAQGRAEQLPYVAAALDALLAAHEGTVVAEITSARPLSKPVEKQLRDALEKATGKGVTLQLHENPALLGGVAIRIGSHLLDATLAGALSTIRTKLLVPTA